MRFPNFTLVKTILALFICFNANQVGEIYGQEVATQNSAQSNETAGYDPLKIDENGKIETVLFDVSYRPAAGQLRRTSDSSEGRIVPVKVYLPAKNTAPVVLFSHGLGGSREGFKHGGEHWARRGYVAVFIQHPGSDESVWRNAGIGGRMSAMREAASAQNLLHRIDDVKAVIDYLERIGRGDAGVATEAKRLQSRMDLEHIGMSGHSFGAITTQMVSGQSPIVPTQHPTDPRIKAAIVLSPSPPKLGQPDRYFSQVTIPWLLMTGTEDNSPIGDQTAESRLKVFAALPAGNKYQVVFHGGTHAFLGERAGGLSAGKETPSHARATEALSTAFWDAYLMGDVSAKQWLDGDGPQKLLTTKDVWQKK